MEISEIKALMKQKKITQLQLSEMTGVPIQTLRYIFTGRTLHPRIDTMQAIEKALGLADSSPLTNAMVETLTNKERRLLRAFNSLLEPMQDIMLEQMEKLAEIKNDGGHYKQA